MKTSAEEIYQELYKQNKSKSTFETTKAKENSGDTLLK